MAKAASQEKLVKEFKELLLQKREELLKNINSELEELSDESHHLSDMDDLAADARDETTTFEILALEQAELEQVDRALKAIEAGTYGKCEEDECGKPINIERLRALPFATMYIECKRNLETSI